MIALPRFFINPLDDKEISNGELQVFSEDHLANLHAANSSGQFDGMLADTGAAHLAFFGGVTNVSLRRALQKAATEQVKLRWEELRTWITTKGEACVVYKAGVPSEAYTEFFPVGNKEYHNATVVGAKTLAVRLKASAAKHAALLGEDFQTVLAGLADAYLEARQLQMAYKGEAAESRGDRDVKKEALKKQLFKNLLAIAALEMDPERCNLYFSPHLLKDRKRRLPVAGAVL